MLFLELSTLSCLVFLRLLFCSSLGSILKTFQIHIYVNNNILCQRIICHKYLKKIPIDLWSNLSLLKSWTSDYFDILHWRLPSITCFKRPFTTQYFGKQHIHQSCCGINCLDPKGFRKIFFKGKTHSHFHN